MTKNLSIGSFVEKRVAAFAVTLFTLGFWLVIATFPNFFLFNPLETVDNVFRIEQLLSTFSWVVYATLPLVFSWVSTINAKSTKPLFLVSVALWPLSVLIIQVTMTIYGFGFYSYLAEYPVLAFTDVIAPMGLLCMGKAVFSTKNMK
ncbi:MAG: hypothetical protein ACOYJ7_03425 [Rhodoluna sp.]